MARFVRIGLGILCAASMGVGLSRCAVSEGGKSRDGGTADAAWADLLDAGARSRPDAAFAPGDAGPSEAWVPLQGAVKSCRYLVPAEGTPMPSPIVWERCPESDAGLSCRVMRIDWSNTRTALLEPNSTRFSLDPHTGAPLLAFTRADVSQTAPNVWNSGYQFVVAEADGPVRNMVFLEDTGCDRCHPQTDFSMQDGWYSLDIEEHDTCDHDSDAEMVALVGGVGQGAPQAAARHVAVPPDRQFLSYVSQRWLAEWDVNLAVSAVDRKSGRRYQVFAPGQDPDLLSPRYITLAREGIFVGLSGDGDTGVMSWDPAAGSRPLLRWYGDFSRGAGNFATDGVHMVWTQGEGKPPGGSYMDYATTSIMTAPFTTDPATLNSTARRLRSDPGAGILNLFETYVVGCGRAAHFTGEGLFIVRLSDGYSWLVGNRPELSFGKAVGISCDEVFVLARGPSPTSSTTIARIGLGSLGAPLPPD